MSRAPDSSCPKLLLLLLLTAAACGGRAAPSSLDETESLPATCGGRLSIPGEPDAALDCSVGVVARGGGLFSLALSSAQGDRINLQLPGIETASYSTSDCLSAEIALHRRSTAFVLDEVTAPGSHGTLELTRRGAMLTGAFRGRVCGLADGVDAGGACADVSIADLHAPVTIEDRRCDCPRGPAHPTPPQAPCEVITCEPSCTLVRCARGAPVCHGN